jgi:hypothetical protein
MSIIGSKALASQVPYNQGLEQDVVAAVNTLAQKGLIANATLPGMLWQMPSGTRLRSGVVRGTTPPEAVSLCIEDPATFGTLFYLAIEALGLPLVIKLEGNYYTFYSSSDRVHVGPSGPTPSSCLAFQLIELAAL